MATAPPSAAGKRKLRRKPNRRASSEMQPPDDDAVWESLSHNNCNFMVKARPKPLCNNTYNGIGRCNRGSCPIANSKYATIIENRGKFFLHIKRTEGAIGWDVVQLARDLNEALETIDKYLEDCPEALVDRVKRLLTKMTRMRELALNKMRELALNKMREMAITDPIKKKKRGVAVSEKSYESEFLEHLLRRASKNPPSKMFAIGGRKRDTEGIRMDDSLKEADSDPLVSGVAGSWRAAARRTGAGFLGAADVGQEPEIEYGESDNELQETDIEDLVRDEPLKDAGYGDIDEDIEEVGTSDLPMKRQPNVFGLESGKSKRKPKAGTSYLTMKTHPNVFELDSGKSKRKPKTLIYP